MIKREYHGKVGTPEYVSWRGMIERCENPAHKQYHDYGGRGIKICKRWRTSFTAFLTDMGLRPPGHSLERKKGDGNYEPNNCKWASKVEQNRNKRNNRRLTFNGRTQLLREWAVELRIDRGTLYRRLKRKLPMREVLRAGRGETAKAT